MVPFPDRVVLLHVPAWRIVPCLTCEEGLSLQATNPNAALVLPLYSHCRKRLVSLRQASDTPSTGLQPSVAHTPGSSDSWSDSGPLPSPVR